MELQEELRQLSIPGRLEILWFVLKVRMRRKIYNLTFRFLKLRLITAAVCFLQPKVESILHSVVETNSQETYLMVLDIAIGTMIAVLLYLEAF